WSDWALLAHAGESHASSLLCEIQIEDEDVNPTPNGELLAAQNPTVVEDANPIQGEAWRIDGEATKRGGKARR
ncbi:hypothetical protein U1Q18_035289, partial [Sarracenia purpurea var. burkii]